MAKTITDLARNEMYVVGDLLDLYSVPAAFTGGAMTLLPGVGFGREGPTLSER